MRRPGRVEPLALAPEATLVSTVTTSTVSTGSLQQSRRGQKSEYALCGRTHSQTEINHKHRKRSPCVRDTEVRSRVEDKEGLGVGVGELSRHPPEES